MNKKEAMNLFIKMIEAGEINGVQTKHVLRGYNIEQISPNEFHISYYRHPHLYGRPSQGKASSAYATLKNTYLINTETREATFVEEKVVDISIDYEELAMENVLPLIDTLYAQRKKLETIESDDEAEEYAESVFNTIEWIPDTDWFKSEYDPANSFDFDQYKKALKTSFMFEFMNFRW